MKKVLTLFLTFILILQAVFTVPVQSAAYDIPSNMDWWADSHFGMFIHLGAYSYYGQGEWAMSEQNISKKEYQENIASKFNPESFDAKTIVDYACKAGMKYIVITAKHHEGLAMWDTQVESFKDYTGTKLFSLQQYTPFGRTGRDILMELKEACDAAGIKFGLYYSIIDWNHPSQETGTSFTTMASMEARANYIKDMKAQLNELVRRYNPSVMWFDGDWTYNNKEATLESWWTEQDGKDLYNYMKELKPDIIVNERVCRGYGLGDFECPEQRVPIKAPSRLWETCQTMNYAWGYKESCEKTYREIKYILREFVTAVSRGGNYLLNIGPKGDGTMTGGSKKILNNIGKWMDIYSDSIYGTVKSPFGKEPGWGVYTQKDKNVYAHVFKWPKNRQLKIKCYKNKKPSGVRLNNSSGKKLKFSIKNNNIIVKLPEKAPDKRDTVIVTEYKN